MATSCKHSGILRTDYETDRTRLDNFPALESGWQELLYWLMSFGTNLHYHEDDNTGTLGELFENQVLTVLTDILQRKGAAYKNSFTKARGTSGQIVCTENLQEKIREWMTRLENYISKNWKTGKDESTAMQAASSIKELLEKSMPVEKEANEKSYYRMLHTVSFLQKHAGYYLDLIENSGDMDGALALLLVYVKNYCHITQCFNERLSSLPELYRKQVLHVCPCRTMQNKGSVVITPQEDESDSKPMQCAEVNAVYITRKNGQATGIRKQTVAFKDVTIAETLFDDNHSTPLSLGWSLESSMFVLSEGKRMVNVSFRLTTDSPIPDNLSSQSFNLQLSSTEGWTEYTCTCHIDTIGNTPRLCFCFTITQDAPVPTPCTEKTHGTATKYPVLRLLTSKIRCPYDWGIQMKFNGVEIQTEVTGIHNFSFYNELGEVDTTQPFSPFGMQAEKGAWFLFGNEEMGLKLLKEVRLKGIWKKLPGTKAEFDKRYKDYAVSGQVIDSSSFTIHTEWQQGGKWHACVDDEQHLFVPDQKEKRSLSHAEIIFDFPPQKPLTRNAVSHYEYSRNCDGFFRATLQAPIIGFGTDAYRTLYTETMIHNSRCKEKKRKDLPSEPVIPVLADAELSYIASEEMNLSDIAHSTIRLSRITALSEEESFPVNKENVQSFLPVAPADNLLYFGFLYAQGEQTLRMYLDMVLPQEKIPFYNPQPDKCIKLAWEYWNGNSWQPIPTESVRTEESQGLTQSGFVEIKLPERINNGHTDRQGKVWLRATVTGDADACLAVRSIQTNCTRLETLNDLKDKPAETETEAAIRQSSRISNRHRAITIKDYERLVMEHFPEVDKAQCIPPQPEEQKEQVTKEIRLVVFSHTEDARYFLSPVWKLTEIQRLIRQYTSPFARLKVINPVYEQVNVHCKAVLWDRVQDEGKALRQLTILAQNYIAPWYRKGEIPVLGQHFSYKELHARMVNHEDLMKLVVLEVNGKSLSRVDINTEDMTFKGKQPWNILLPEIKIELLSPHDGINNAEIGSNFIIG